MITRRALLSILVLFFMTVPQLARAAGGCRPVLSAQAGTHRAKYHYTDLFSLKAFQELTTWIADTFNNVCSEENAQKLPHEGMFVPYSEETIDRLIKDGRSLVMHIGHNIDGQSNEALIFVGRIVKRRDVVIESRGTSEVTVEMSRDGNKALTVLIANVQALAEVPATK